MRVEAYEIENKQMRVEVSLGDERTYVLTNREALELAHKLLLTLEQTVAMSEEGEHMWLLIAVGSYADLVRMADAMARIHHAAIWAVSFDEITGILAWPRFSKLSTCR